MQGRRLDFACFFLYSAVYVGFMALAAFRSDLMATKVFSGINLAVVYGMGLIVGAIGLALFSSFLHRGGTAR